KERLSEGDFEEWRRLYYFGPAGKEFPDGWERAESDAEVAVVNAAYQQGVKDGARLLAMLLGLVQLPQPPLKRRGTTAGHAVREVCQRCAYRPENGTLRRTLGEVSRSRKRCREAVFGPLRMSAEDGREGLLIRVSWVRVPAGSPAGRPGDDAGPSLLSVIV